MRLYYNVAKLVFGGTILLTGSARAALIVNSITFQTGLYSTAPAFTTGGDYITAFNALPGKSVVASLPIFDNVRNNTVFGTGTNTLGEHFQINFTLGPGDEGIYQFRLGIDFGLGGEFLIDSSQVECRTTDMYWAGSYTNPLQILSGLRTLAAGAHTIDIYGFEGCCDGAQQGQWAGPSSGTFQTFAATPEPATLGPVGFTMLGLIILGRWRTKIQPAPKT